MSETTKSKLTDSADDLKTTRDTITTTLPDAIYVCDNLILGVRWDGFEPSLLSREDILRLKIAKAHIEDYLSQLVDIGDKLDSQDKLDGLRTNPLLPEEIKRYNELSSGIVETLYIVTEITGKLKSFDIKNVAPLFGKK